MGRNFPRGKKGSQGRSLVVLPLWVHEGALRAPHPGCDTCTVLPASQLTTLLGFTFLLAVNHLLPPWAELTSSLPQSPLCPEVGTNVDS